MEVPWLTAATSVLQRLPSAPGEWATAGMTATKLSVPPPPVATVTVPVRVQVPLPAVAVSVHAYVPAS